SYLDSKFYTCGPLQLSSGWYGHPATVVVKRSLSRIFFACAFSSSTSQLIHANFPRRNAASGLVTQTPKCAERSARNSQSPSKLNIKAGQNLRSSGTKSGFANLSYIAVAMTPGCTVTTCTSGSSAATYSIKLATAILLTRYPELPTALSLGKCTPPVDVPTMTGRSAPL